MSGCRHWSERMRHLPASLNRCSIPVQPGHGWPSRSDGQSALLVAEAERAAAARRLDVESRRATPDITASVRAPLGI
jgi:hypothetical protein